MHKHNYGRTLKLQSAVVTLDIRSRSPKSNFLTPNNVSMYGKCSKNSNTLKLRTPKIIAENNF